MKVARNVAIIICVLMLAMACASTLKGKYAQGLDDYEFMMEAYKSYYATASPATQIELKAEVAPVLKKVSVALDNWKLALNDETKEQAYLGLYRQAVALLLEYGIVAKKEG